MQDVREIAEDRFAAAFECAGHRPARRDGLEGAAERAADAFRVTLVGVAAFHLNLLSTPVQAEADILHAAANYATVVDDDVDVPGFAASRAFGVALTLFRSMCPLEVTLSVIAEEFTATVAPAAVRRHGFFGRRKLANALDRSVAESVRYALNFFERQTLGLDERPEIALLDE